MALDLGSDKDKYLGGVRDYSHQRIAKGLMDKKRAAKIGGGMDGMPHSDEPQADAVMDAPPESGEMDAMAGDAMPNMEPDGDEGMAGGMMEMALSPEEAAIIKELRAAKQS